MALYIHFNFVNIIEKCLFETGRPNFSLIECNALVDAVGQHYDALFGKFSSTLSNERKKELWKDVVLRVNAVSTVEPPRTLLEITKKYQSLKTTVRKVETNNSNEMKKTGGGSAKLQSQNPIGEKILALLPTVEISGIAGGLDISKRELISENVL